MGRTNAQEATLGTAVGIHSIPRSPVRVRKAPAVKPVVWKEVRASYAPGKYVVLIVPSDYKQVAGSKDWPIKFERSTEGIWVQAGPYNVKSPVRDNARHVIKYISASADKPHLGSFTLCRGFVFDEDGGIGGFLVPDKASGVAIGVGVSGNARISDQALEVTKICTWIAAHNKP